MEGTSSVIVISCVVEVIVIIIIRVIGGGGGDRLKVAGISGRTEGEKCSLAIEVAGRNRGCSMQRRFKRAGQGTSLSLFS